MTARVHHPNVGAERGFPLRRDWLLLYLGVACCVAIALALILVAVGVL